MASILANAGRAIITNALKLGATEPKQAGWGTGAGTSGVTDTTLFTEKALDLATGTGSRTAATTSQVTTSVTNDTYQAVVTLTASAGGTATNFGLFDNAAIGSGNLFLKSDFTGVVLAAGDSITFTAKLQFT